MQSGSAYSLGAATSPKSAREWLADSSLWMSRQRFRDLLTRMNFGGHTMVTEASVTNFGRSAGSAVYGKKKRANAYVHKRTRIVAAVPSGRSIPQSCKTQTPTVPFSEWCSTPKGSAQRILHCHSRLRLIWNSQVLFRYVRGHWALHRKRTSAKTNQWLCSPCCGAPLPPMGRSA